MGCGRRGAGWGGFICGAGWGVVGLGVVWGGWYGYAAHRLEKTLAERRMRGEPASALDVVGKPAASENNAYELAVRAAKSLTLTADERELVDSPTSYVPTALPLSTAQIETARGMLDRQGSTLELIREARAAPRCWCPIDPANLARSLSYGNNGKLRQLASFERAAALYHHQVGRDDVGVQDIRDIQLISKITGAGPFLIDELVSIAIGDVASQMILHIAPGCQADGICLDAARDSTSGVASRLSMT